MRTWESYKNEVKNKKDATYNDIAEMEEMQGPMVFPLWSMQKRHWK